MAEEMNVQYDDGENQTDKERLLSAMKNFADGVFTPISVDGFDDPELGIAFNGMLEKIMLRNNGFLARINDAQSRIGDTSCLKSMFEKIAEQQETIAQLQAARAQVNPEKESMEDRNYEFLALAMQFSNMLDPAGNQMEHAINLIDALPLWKQEEVADINPQSLVEPIKELRRVVQFSTEAVKSTGRRADAISEDAKLLFESIDQARKLNQSFLEGVDNLTESYKSLSGECLETGRHLYRISRDIDNARNDLFRCNSRPTMHDSLSVYEVDHITLAWRLYNNVVEFESLRLTQLNNPKTCKLGVWLNGESTLPFREEECFQKLVEAHEDFHEKSVACYMAKQEYDTTQALAHFAEVMKALEVLREAMTQMHIYLREIGITEETDVWKFRG